jgi:hypothetical protein
MTASLIRSVSPRCLPSPIPREAAGDESPARGHRWLWVRDVGCDEDTARPGDNAPVIWAILIGFLRPRVRPLACRTRPQGVRARTHQLEKVDAILTQGVHPPQ